MSERTRKIPVNERQFVWVQNDDNGEVVLLVGPTMVSPTAAEKIVRDDGEGGFVEDTSGRPQQMVELGDNHYAVLYNPLDRPEAEGPNGKFKNGRNELKPLKNGTRQMIAGPNSFYLRPGQRAEVRDAHKLKSDQYLVVECYGQVDKTAPYYDITSRSAAITRSTSETDTKTDKGGDKGEVAHGTGDLRRGQLVVIRGLDTQFYIPPTGVDIVPDTSIDASGAGIGASAARALLGKLDQNVESPVSNAPRRHMQTDAVDQSARARHAAAAQYSADVVSASGGAGAAASTLDYAPQERERGGQKRGFAPELGRGRQLGSRGGAQETYETANAANVDAGKLMAAIGVAGPAGLAGPAGPAGGAMMMAMPADFAEEAEQDDNLRRQLEREAKQARLVRNAVVLGEKEYCVIIDADGKREIKRGPARVFPGPYDTFMIAGSRNRVYDAYELLPTRALWLRVIAQIAREGLQRKLPHGYKLEDGKANFHPGDEILLTGVSTFFVPFNEIEVLSPRSGQAVIGNDHASVFIEAIGIDQKSGIYVRDLATGEVRLVKGKQSYLVDPRKEVQIVRVVSPEQWNLWIACNECRTKQATGPTKTPWALSVTVPPNTAVLATSATGQRVIEGPCVTLLEYEESLQTLTLSTGTPKKDDTPIKTAFLRTVGNRISDIIMIETSDFVRIGIKVSYTVTFVPEHKNKWFNHENYIQFLVDHLRSIVRARCRTTSLPDLWPKVPQIVRDVILGVKEKEGARPGRLFAENGARVDEVEVLTAKIEDEAIAKLMTDAQSEAVKQQIGDRRAQDNLTSAKLRANVAREEATINEESHQRQAKLNELVADLAHRREMQVIRDSEVREREKLTGQLTRQAESLKAQLEREHTSRESQANGLRVMAGAEAEATRTRSEAELDAKQKINALDIALINAKSAATVAEHNSVQKGLIEAMTALGDKAFLAQAAENMNLVSLIKGQNVVQILEGVLGNTRVAKTLQAMGEGNGGANRVAAALSGAGATPPK